MTRSPAAASIFGLLILSMAAHAVTVAWTRTVSGTSDRFETGRAAAVAPSGDVYVVGQKAVAGQDTNIWIRKYSPNGITRWTRTVNGPASWEDLATDVAVDDAGNIYVVGYISVGGEDVNIWISKYSATGFKLWTRTVDGPASGSDAASSVALDGAGNLYVAGFVTVANEFRNIWVRKYTSEGAKLWTRTVNGPGNLDDWAFAVSVDSAGNLFVAGSIYVSGEKSNIWIRKYDSTGSKLWTRTVDGPVNGWDHALGVAVDSFGDLYVVGEIATDDFYTDIWARKYSGAGAKLWTRTIAGSADRSDSLRDVVVDASGSVYVTGWKRVLTVTGGSESVAWTAKYNSSGNMLWSEEAEGPVDYAAGDGIAVDANDGVYVTGGIWTNRTSYDIWIRKYVP